MYICEYNDCPMAITIHKQIKQPRLGTEISKLEGWYRVWELDYGIIAWRDLQMEVLMRTGAGKSSTRAGSFFNACFFIVMKGALAKEKKSPNKVA